MFPASKVWQTVRTAFPGIDSNVKSVSVFLPSPSVTMKERVRLLGKAWQDDDNICIQEGSWISFKSEFSAGHSMTRPVNFFWGGKGRSYSRSGGHSSVDSSLVPIGSITLYQLAAVMNSDWSALNAVDRVTVQSPLGFLFNGPPLSKHFLWTMDMWNKSHGCVKRSACHVRLIWSNKLWKTRRYTPFRSERGEVQTAWGNIRWLMLLCFLCVSDGGQSRAERSGSGSPHVCHSSTWKSLCFPAANCSLSAAVEKHRPGAAASERQDNSGERSESRLAESTHSSKTEWTCCCLVLRINDKMLPSYS